MKKIWSDIIKSAILGNILHLVLSFLYTFGDSNNGVVASVALTSFLGMWLLVGFLFGFKMEKKSETSLMLLSLVSIVPILVFLIACQILEGVTSLSSMQNYSLFYFLGTPVLFWNKPFIPIMKLFKESSIYIQMDINVAVVFLVIFIGGYLGFHAKKYLKTDKRVR